MGGKRTGTRPKASTSIRDLSLEEFSELVSKRMQQGQQARDAANLKRSREMLAREQAVAEKAKQGA